MRWIFGNCCVKPFLLSPTQLENQEGKNSLAESQNHSIRGWIWRHLWTLFSQPPSQRRAEQRRFLRTSPVQFWIFPGKKTHWATCTIALPVKEVFLWHLNGISCLSICVCCPLPFHEGPWEWAGSVFFTDSGQWFMHVYNAPSDPSPLQAEQFLLSQPLPTLTDAPGL